MVEFVMRYNVDYGASELKKNYQKYVWRGLALAAILHLIGLSAYWGVVYLATDNAPTHVVRILKYTELGPPPSISNANTPPAIAVSAPAVKPSVGVPVPVPDAEVSPEMTIATQTEMSQVVAPTGEGTGTGQVSIEKDIQIDGPPPDFVPYEKAPTIVKTVKPNYSDLAKRAGIEGTVWVRLWVDKEGRVRKAEIMKSDTEMFNQPAIDAAMQFVFTPAMMKNGPVAVWVAIPFRFKLDK